MSCLPPVALRLAAVAALLLPVWGHAQTRSQTTPQTAPQTASQDPAQRGGEPLAERRVTEDDGVRIEELRVRGETQRIVVRSKVGGARPYEILPAGGGRDLSQDKRAIGQRVWSVLNF
jgi:hypothetical protein